MKIRTIAVAGGVLGLAAIGTIPALAAGPNSGNCGTSQATPSSGDQVNQTFTDPTGGTGTVYLGAGASSGEGGIYGPHGYLQGSGSGSSVSISGSNPDSGVNGSAGTSGVCIGDTTAGHGVSAP